VLRNKRHRIQNEAAPRHRITVSRWMFPMFFHSPYRSTVELQMPGNAGTFVRYLYIPERTGTQRTEDSTLKMRWILTIVTSII